MAGLMGFGVVLWIVVLLLVLNYLVFTGSDFPPFCVRERPRISHCSI